jgi:glycosyltransferase involved in cell wall biosynthesis
MAITIAIATHNRSDELARTLSTLECIESRGELYEILIVDNASTDDTAYVAERYISRLGGLLRYVYEADLGLSRARDRAVEEARYEIIAFLDDDVNVDRQWLRILSGAYERGDFAAIGGRAFLVYPDSRPRWLSDRTEGLLTKVDLGAVPRSARPDELYGVNLSFKKEWLQRAGRFRSDLGRVGQCLLGGEEGDMLARIAEIGGELLYDPGPVVGHRVAPERLRRRWFWSRLYWGAQSTARLLPSRCVSYYEFVRSVWHITVATRDLLWAVLCNGPTSARAFDQTVLVAQRFGHSVGLLKRLSVARPTTRVDKVDRNQAGTFDREERKVNRVVELR